MRLPQSSRRSLFILFFSILTLVTVLPAGAATTQQLVCAPSSVKFGTVTVGQSETQIIELTNTGQTAVTVSASSMSSSEFSLSGLKLPLDLAAGQSIAFSANFLPTSKGWTSGSVTFTSNASNSTLKVGFVGTGVNSEVLTATPASLSFGEVSLGKSLTLPLVLTNACSYKEPLTALQTQGTGFSVSAPSLPLTLSPGQSVTLNVTFAPQASGLTGGSVYISVAGVSMNVPFSGTGETTGQLTVAPTAINFGSVEVGTTNTQSSTLSATGGSVTVSSVSSSNSQFAIAGVSFPLTIASGQSVSFDVKFAPSVAGKSSGSITFVNNGSTTKILESEAGTGTMPYVTLSWVSSPDSVSGYNVYRGTAPGVYSKINSALDPNTSFTDVTATPGATYYYAATAVSSSGEESSFSAPVEVSVP
jgi:ASPM-SPD-2-Hydin domain-containing protein/centrosomal CEP192-like protein